MPYQLFPASDGHLIVACGNDRQFRILTREIGVPELADVEGKAVHQPWKLRDGIPEGYPEPMVDHKAERQDALARYDQVKAART